MFLSSATIECFLSFGTMAVLLPAGVLALSIGLQYQDQCSYNEFLPFLLMGNGFALCLLGTKYASIPFQSRVMKEWKEYIRSVFGLYLFNLILCMIAGYSIGETSSKADIDDPKSPMFCHPDFMRFYRWLHVLANSFLALMTFILFHRPLGIKDPKSSMPSKDAASEKS